MSSAAAPITRPRRRRRSALPLAVTTHAALILVTIVFGYPLLWMLFGAGKQMTSFFSNLWWVSLPYHWHNFVDAWSTGNVGRSLAQMALLDLGAAASALMDRGVGTFVGVDEFGALEASALERLFARGRAAGFSVALGTQTLADLSAAGPAVRERIGATVSALICHRIGEQADAEWIAQLIGAVPTWQTTIRTEGHSRHTREGTRTRGYRFDVNPAELQRLGPGRAYVARLDSDAARRARVVRVVPPWRRLPERPTRSSFHTPIEPDHPNRPNGPA